MKGGENMSFNLEEMLSFDKLNSIDIDGMISYDDFSSLIEYYDPFERKEFLKLKRFQRYVKKAESIVLEFFNDSTEEIKKTPVSTMEELVYRLILVQDNEKAQDNDEPIALINLLSIPVIVKDNNPLIQEVYDWILENENSDTPLIPESPDFIQQEFSLTMEHFLYEKRLYSKEEITKDTFISFGLPEYDYEIIRILYEFFSRVCADYFLYASQMKSISQKTKRKEKASLRKEIKEKEKIIQSQNEELEDLKHQIKSLKEYISNQAHIASQKEKKEEKNKREWEYAYFKKYNKLVNKYNSLMERYQHVLSYEWMEEEEPLEDIFEKESMEVDMNGKYAFVIDPSHTRCNSLQKEFPNATFIESDKQLGDADCVIFMTNQMAHQGYKNIKEQCKLRDIPYRHCPNTNLDMIKEQIAIALT